jgi:hypothetical protein
MGVQGFEQVKIRGNRLDNLTEAQNQTRQIISYRARFSDTISDAVLWCCASGAISRLTLLLVEAPQVPPVYPLGFFLAVVVIGGVVTVDSVRKYPTLLPAFALRGFYVVAGLLSTLL